MNDDPNAPEAQISTDFPLPTQAETAAQALSAWIAENPSADMGGLRVLRDHQTVVVYWKGTAPADLRSLAARQPVPVTFRVAAYSREELMPVAKSLVSNNRDIVDSAGPSSDYCGVGVRLKSTAPSTALAEMRAASSVPIVFEGFGDSIPLGGS
jgi:hypothetical protein